MACILAVDDHKNVRLLIEQELSDEGHTVTLARNGAEAVEYLSHSKPDLVILDAALPDVDGAELLQRILCRDCTMPVILYSAYSDIETQMDYPLADAHVLKSSDLTELKAAIERLLAARLVECAV